MVTKSKSNSAVIWSVVSILIAFGSLAYCFPHITELASSGYERTSRTLAYFIQVIKGGTV
ncbi:hypothetical protein NCCP2716_15040 [Sporosarcina sp. NCCP-2716]|uniref:hypothetical protein n=1 Tax=Sporosarcina sp. NCCP-2716 TaxID=2943679 RepID=UPI00203DE984|nr:hypothetical protein [Sporosarcina sp. NCCP-2716]GKV69006.1 hypothetical protein NCCP2716_15040 [Sporosarcina sp. NCCP-2716]